MCVYYINKLYFDNKIYVIYIVDNYKLYKYIVLQYKNVDIL